MDKLLQLAVESALIAGCVDFMIYCASHIVSWICNIRSDVKLSCEINDIQERVLALEEEREKTTAEE